MPDYLYGLDLVGLAEDYFALGALLLLLHPSPLNFMNILLQMHNRVGIRQSGEEIKNQRYLIF